MEKLNFTDKERRIACYDDGKSGDRYTVVFIGFPSGPRNTFDALGMNAAPFHPQGFGQHCSAMRGRHLGKRIAFNTLPEDCRKLVIRDLEGHAPIDTFKR